MLPDQQKQLLDQIADQAEHRYQVYDQWKLRTQLNRGLGISVLFAGESGTGKTMAAEVIANRLRLPLYRIDLSAVVSKYIGERLGNGDHIVQWRRPGRIRTIDWQSQKQLPEWLLIRETRVQVQQPGFRSRSIIVVTTMLDVEKVTASDLADLYRARWNAELDFRSLNDAMRPTRNQPVLLTCFEFVRSVLQYWSES